VTVTVQEISALSKVHDDPSVNNYEITRGITDLTQRSYKYPYRVMASYVTKIILRLHRIEKMAVIINY